MPFTESLTQGAQLHTCKYTAHTHTLGNLLKTYFLVSNISQRVQSSKLMAGSVSHLLQLVVNDQLNMLATNESFAISQN